jgi:DNA-binding response OmpR family regulator
MLERHSGREAGLAGGPEHLLDVEVLARVRSQLRRYTQLGSKKEEEKPNVYTVGPIVLDEEKKSVTVDGDEVALTPIEFNILRLLMKNPGRIYSSAQIYELVWKEDSLGAETSVSVHIRHLRQKLEINPSEPRYLKVVWGLALVEENLKQPVSVATPVYRQSAMWGEMGTPISTMT